MGNVPFPLVACRIPQKFVVVGESIDCSSDSVSEAVSLQAHDGAIRITDAPDRVIAFLPNLDRYCLTVGIGDRVQLRDTRQPSVVIAGDGVVVSSGVGNLFFNSGKFLLQREEIVVCFQIGVGFHQSEELAQGGGQHVLQCSALFWGVGGDSGIAGATRRFIFTTLSRLGYPVALLNPNPFALLLSPLAK